MLCLSSKFFVWKAWSLSTRPACFSNISLYILSNAPVLYLTTCWLVFSRYLLLRYAHMRSICSQSPMIILVIHSCPVSLLPFAWKWWSIHVIQSWLNLPLRKLSQPICDYAQNANFNLFLGVWNIVPKGEGGSEGILSGSRFSRFNV
jgi:hypothetical protein